MPSTRNAIALLEYMHDPPSLVENARAAIERSSLHQGVRGATETT